MRCTRTRLALIFRVFANARTPMATPDGNETVLDGRYYNSPMERRDRLTSELPPEGAGAIEGCGSPPDAQPVRPQGEPRLSICRVRLPRSGDRPRFPGGRVPFLVAPE